MNIKDYEYVYEIARQGSVSKAAEKLYITQGALTKYLQRLENGLSTPLFYRTGNRFTPTRAGELYLAKAAQIIDLDHELEDEITLLASSRDAAIRFGYPMGLTSFVSEFLLPAFFAEYPDACLSLEEDSSKSLIQSVEDGKLDICLAYVREEKSALHYDEIAVSPGMVLAVPVGSPLVRAAKRAEGRPFPVLEGQAWMDEPYIHIAPHTRSGQAADHYFRHLGRRPRTRLYVDDTRSALVAVEQKLGVSLLTAVRHTDRLIRFLILPDLPEEWQRLCLVSRRGEGGTRSREGFVRLVHETYEAI